jgi:histidine triad (HIT) family protein
MNRSRAAATLLTFALGLLAGAFLFTDVQPRSFLAIRHCEQCLHPNEITGLAGAVLVTKFPGFLPKVVLETDKTVAIEHPSPSADHHYVILPKKDIKNLGTLTAEDSAYLVDVHGVIGELIRSKGLTDYRLWSNGPEGQAVAYLHFHLAGSD